MQLRNEGMAGFARIGRAAFVVLAVCAACALAAVFVAPQPAYAGRAYSKCIKNGSVKKVIQVGKSLTAGEKFEGYVWVYNRVDSAEGVKDWSKKAPKMSKAKSSNSKVAKLVFKKNSYEGAENRMLCVKIKKPGTATLTCTVKSDKSTHKFKVKVIAWKYKNPLKKLKVGSKSLKKKFNKKPAASVKRGKCSGKFSIKLRKGWKIMDARYCASSIAVVDGDRAETPYSKSLKNGKKCKLSDKGTVYISLVNDDGCYEYLDLHVK